MRRRIENGNFTLELDYLTGPILVPPIREQPPGGKFNDRGAGGLIYNREYNEGLSRLSSNDNLVLAGTFHGVHLITSQISPIPGSSGIQVLETDAFRLQCFQTLTGTKFLLITEPRQSNVDIVMKRIYELYSDYVMKNPFYQLEMPIRCEEFDRNLQGYAKSVP